MLQTGRSPGRIEEGVQGALGIRFRGFHQFGLEGVMLDITHQGIEVGFIGDVPRPVAPLPEMAAAAVFFC